MEMFHLTDVIGVMSFQSRQELNGEDKKPAATLHFTATVPNEMLDKFDPQLLPMYFRKEIKGDEPLDDIADEGTKKPVGLTRLKVRRQANVIEWDEDFTNYEAHIDYGVKSMIKLGGCKVDKFKLTLKDGGSMIMSWRCSAHPNEEQAGKLHTLNGREVTTSLIAPAEDGNEGQGDLVGGGRP